MQESHEQSPKVRLFQRSSHKLLRYFYASLFPFPYWIYFFERILYEVSASCYTKTVYPKYIEVLLVKTNLLCYNL